MNQEAVERKILNFHPIRQKGAPQEINFGCIEGTSSQVVYGVFPYQMRVVNLPGEPFSERWTRQPVVALVENKPEGRLVRTLAYHSDINKLTGDLAEKVLARLSPFEYLYEQLLSGSTDSARIEWEP